MTNRYEYTLLEFTANLAEAEASYGEKLQTIIDTFSQSRLDLPLKRLSEIAKVHGRAAQNLRKYMDPKKNDLLNLWKMCNIYSCCAVDMDKAMRETRGTLRAKMTVDGAVIEKPKKRNIFNSILTTTSRNGSGNLDINPPAEKENGRKWFPKLSGYERKAELRASRKTTASSLEEEKNEDRLQMSGSKSTPPTPPVIRSSHATLKGSASVTTETFHKPPRPPKHLIPDAPSSVPPPIPIAAPPPQFYMEEKRYATPIYGDMQKSSGSLNNNNRVGIVEEHSLRHQDDSPTNAIPSVVRIRTDVDVARENKRNETIVNVFDSNHSIKKSHYVNLRPQIAQKPQTLSGSDRSPPTSDVAPTFISVECYASTVPIPSPRTYFNSNDLPSSQRSSSSAYSSNFSSASSSNVTSFAVDQARSPSPTIENAQIVRVVSPDDVLHRF